MIFESKLNHMSIEELDLLMPNYTFLLSYASDKELTRIAVNIANAIVGSELIGVSYNPFNANWYCRRYIKQEAHLVKAGHDKSVVEAAAIDFAKKNNLQIYR